MVVDKVVSVLSQLPAVRERKLVRTDPVDPP